MPKFTIECTYHLPIFRHRTYDAPNLARACRLAIEDDDWDSARKDYDSSGAPFITGAWSGTDNAYHGPDLAVPSHFADTLQRKADHFDELLAQLDFAAQNMGLSIIDFEHWLPRARAAIEKARAILEDRPDPGGPFG